MSLEQALAMARASNPELRVSSARLAARRAEARVPRARWLPAVGLSAQAFAGTANNSTASVLGSRAVDLPRIGGSRAATDPASADWAPYASTLVAAGATQQVYDFGRTAAQSALADAAVEVESRREESSRLAVDFAVREAYFAVLAARAIVRSAEESLRRAGAHRDMARAWVEGNMRPHIELDRAEADLARIDVNRVRALAGLEGARATLAAVVGSDEPELDAAGELDAAAPVPSLAEALRLAGEHDPLVAEALARVRAQHAQTEALGAEARPDLALTASVSMRAGGAPANSGDVPALNGFLPVVPNWNAGLIFNWRVYDAALDARRAASQRAEDALRAEALLARQGQAAAVRQAWLAVAAAQRALPALERALEAARANYPQAEARFRAGVGTVVELADAESLRTEAEAQLTLGRFQLARARARFSRTVAEGL